MRLKLREDSPIVAWLEEHRPGVIEALTKLDCTELEVRNVSERRMKLTAVAGNYTLKFCLLNKIEMTDAPFDRQVDNDDLCIVVDWCIIGD